MTIRITCDGCGVAMKIKDELAGKQGKCPKCKAQFVIPELAADEVAGDEKPADDATEPAFTEEEAAAAASDAPEETPVAAQKTSDSDPAAAEDDDSEWDDADEDDEEWEDDEDEDDEDEDDDLVDMPLELTAAPVTTPPPPPAATPEAPPRDRKKASETKKATRMSSKSKPGGGGGFDPTDVLFEDDGAADQSTGSPDGPERPTGRVLSSGTDDLDDDDLVDTTPDRAAMADMFKDFTPAGGRKKKEVTVASTSLAAEVLARRAEEKRGKSSEPDEAEEEEASDIIEMLRQIGQQYKKEIIGFLIVFAGVSFFSYSVFGPEGPEYPDLVEVEGTVLQAGEPVANARLEFEPSDEITPGSGGFASTDENGEYYVEYVAGVYGLPPGKYKVRIAENSGATMGVADVVVGEDGAPAMNFEFE